MLYVQVLSYWSIKSCTFFPLVANLQYKISIIVSQLNVSDSKSTMDISHGICSLRAFCITARPLVIVAERLTAFPCRTNKTRGVEIHKSRGQSTGSQILSYGTKRGVHPVEGESSSSMAETFRWGTSHMHPVGDVLILYDGRIALCYVLLWTW